MSVERWAHCLRWTEVYLNFPGDERGSIAEVRKMVDRWELAKDAVTALANERVPLGLPRSAEPGNGWSRSWMIGGRLGGCEGGKHWFDRFDKFGTLSGRRKS